MLIIAALPGASHAEIPRTIAMQGILTNATGVPKPDGSYNVTFRLYDALSGGSLLWTETNKPVSVSGARGLFTTSLGAPTAFGALAFNVPYFVEIQVSGEAAPMAPRVSLQAVPYALSAGAANLTLPFTGSASVAAPGAALSVTDTDSGTAISGVGKLGNGVYGLSGTSAGLTPAIGLGFGVKGDSANGFGVVGQSYSGWGIYGQQGSSSGYSPPYVAGIWGDSSANVGVMGTSAANAGLAGYSTGWNGVIGYSQAAGQAGVAGVSNGAGAGNGIYGRSDNGGAGAYGISANGTGVVGVSNVGAGVYGESLSNGLGTGNNGVSGVAHVSGRAGLFGQNDAPGAYGIYGSAQGAASIGVVGTASGDSSSKGVYGSTLGGVGVWGTGDSTGAIGIHGQNSVRAYGELGTYLNGASAGILGFTPSAAGGSAYGIWGIAENRLANAAGRFDGDVLVYGAVRSDDLVVSGYKHFKIDDPLDPANKYLVHSCAEGPDALNIYSGNIITDADGKAVVRLPAYFEAENKDYRYQLTIVEDGDSVGFAQAKVSRKVKGNRFEIRTDVPNVQVSWQVMGVRNDAYIQAHPEEVEQDKGADRGHYLRPELFGKPESMRIGYRAAPPPRS